MAIATRCPHCQKAYSLKDELAGKRVTCANPACKKVFPVQPELAAPAATNGNVKPTPKAAVNIEDLALSALAEEPKVAAPEAQVETATIKVVCKFCDHACSYDSRMAGKNAPCQNEECRKIIKVPLPTKADPKDWRNVQKRPSAARVDNEQLEGAWGNIQTTAVSREAIVEAEADRIEEREPRSWAKIIQLTALVLGIVLFLIVGVVWTMRRRAEGKQDRAMETALAFAKADAKKKEPARLNKEQSGLIHLLAGQYEARQSKAKDAKDRYVAARGGLDQRTGNSPERCVALIEIAVGLAELAGTKEQAEQGIRLEWDKDKLSGDVRSVLASLPPVGGEDAREMRARAFRRLTRVLAASHHTQAVVGLANSIGPAEDRGELLSVIALELLALGHRDEAEKLATQASISPGTAPNSLITLWMALSSADSPEEKRKTALSQAQKIAPPPTKDAALSLLARTGYAAGWARQGKVEEARSLAWSAGKPDERLRAGATVAAIIALSRPGEVADLEQCAKLLEGELKGQGVSPWLLMRLVELAAQAEKPELAGRFAARIADPGMRAWGQLEVLRARLKAMSGQPAGIELAKEVGEADKMAHWLAWTEISRHNAANGSATISSEVGKWETDVQKAFGYAGLALAER